MGAIARRLEPASAAINAMTIPLRIQPVRCMACELPCASMLMFTFLDIIACSASFGRRYRTRQLDTTKIRPALITQSGHPLSLERYDHDQTSSQNFECRL